LLASLVAASAAVSGMTSILADPFAGSFTTVQMCLAG